MARQSVEKQILNKVAAWAAILVTVVLLVISGLAWWGASFAGNMVHDQLAAQKIFFPAEGSKGFDAATYPDLQKYAGQQVDNGDKARAYAEGYIGRHLKEAAGGKSYAEISSAAMANPKDAKLQAQKQLLFQGSTLQGLLLGDGYAFGTIAKIAATAAFVCLGLAVVSALFAVSKLKYLKG